MSMLETKIRKLQEEMSTLNESLQNNRVLYQNYDATIRDTEMGFKKVSEHQNMSINNGAFVVDFRKQPNVVKSYSARC